jgi:hypothetical protein
MIRLNTVLLNTLFDIAGKEKETPGIPAFRVGILTPSWV